MIKRSGKCKADEILAPILDMAATISHQTLTVFTCAQQMLFNLTFMQCFRL